MTSVRVLSVIAAALLVGAFAIATILSYDMSLSALITMLNRDIVNATHDFVTASLPSWVWTNMLLPVLLRPAWLLPAGIGIICAGAAATVASSGSAQRSRRKRS